MLERKNRVIEIIVETFPDSILAIVYLRKVIHFSAFRKRLAGGTAEQVCSPLLTMYSEMISGCCLRRKKELDRVEPITTFLSLAAKAKGGRPVLFSTIPTASGYAFQIILTSLTRELS